MRFGKWRGVPLALALASLLGMAATSVRADGWRLRYTIPREVPAYNYSTGGPYYAPPVPYGHYAKDYYGDATKALGGLYGGASTLFGSLGGHCNNCGSLFGCNGNDCGQDDGCGLGHGCGGLGAGNGCGFCTGLGLFHHGNDGLAGAGSCLDGHGAGLGQGLLSGMGHKKHFAPCHASTVGATGQAQPAAQRVVAPTAQAACGIHGCAIAGRHSHLGNMRGKTRCRFCGGGGCGVCGGAGIGDPCATCGGRGMLGGLGHGKLCGMCGGCGLGHGGSGCGFCGGKGCSHCHQGLLSNLVGSTMGRLHRDKMDWFVGAGGPVPLTVGYVPYIVTTRSPRDYFAFPPMHPNDP